MSPRHLGRGKRVIVGGAVLFAIAGMTAACGSSGDESPSSTTPTTSSSTAPSSSAAPPSPTEKSIDPTGGNVFSPNVKAPPAPNIPGGQHPGINGVP